MPDTLHDLGCDCDRCSPSRCEMCEETIMVTVERGGLLFCSTECADAADQAARS
jgi:hypothetical protein